MKYQGGTRDPRRSWMHDYLRACRVSYAISFGPFRVPFLISFDLRDLPSVDTLRPLVAPGPGLQVSVDGRSASNYYREVSGVRQLVITGGFIAEVLLYKKMAR